MSTPEDPNPPESESPQPTPSPSSGGESIPFPERFQDFPVTFFSSMGRADMHGATPQEQTMLRHHMLNGWMRENEYNDKGEQTFGYEERRYAREQYEEMTLDIESRSTLGGDVGADFDWQAWREEYEAQQAA